MSSFTGGKWEYYEPLGVICNEERGIAQVYEAGHDERYCKPPREGEANARLIAAAPEMYRLLKEELIPTSDYDGILSFSREAKIRAVLGSIDGKDA